VIYAAGRALGRPELDNGDYQASPTRRGILYRNDLTIGPAESFRWLPAAEADLLSFDAGKREFNCVSALRVERPDGAREELPLRPNADCSSVVDMAADAYLIASAAGPARAARAAAPLVGGLALLRAAAYSQGNTTTLELEWRVEAPPEAPLALIPRLKDVSGNLLLDAVFPSRGAKRPYPMVWPLIDDLARDLGLKRGQTLRQTFLLRLAAPPPSPGTALELDVFTITPAGTASPLGSVTAPVAFAP